MKCTPFIMTNVRKLNLREDTHDMNTNETGTEAQRKGLRESWKIIEQFSEEQCL